MLPDLTVLLVSSGREIGRRGTALSGLDVELLAPVVLAQMRELAIMPGMVVTVDVTSAPVGLVCTKVDAAIRRKLFKVLAVHVEASEHVSIVARQQELLTAAFARFGVPPEA